MPKTETSRDYAAEERSILVNWEEDSTVHGGNSPSSQLGSRKDFQERIYFMIFF